MSKENWYIITKDKEGLSGLWRKLTKDPSYQEFNADITSLRGDSDFEKDVVPLVDSLNGGNKTSFVIQAQDSNAAVMSAYFARFINAGQRESLFKKIKPAPKKSRNNKRRP
jgi:hypothetical protein|tara:strand:+ start:1044 stop:1376 length:333 start_codon:yes stop_codon:yes gene_type:complete